METDVTAPDLSKATQPRRKRGPQTPRNWRKAYLKALRKEGVTYLAAELAGVSPRTVQREREINPEFNELCEIARETKIDAMEAKLEALADKTGNPLGLFGRLKAMRPETWVERNQQLIVNVDLAPPPDQAHAVLSSLLGRITPATQILIAPKTLEPHHDPISPLITSAASTWPDASQTLTNATDTRMSASPNASKKDQSPASSAS